ncbi:hypothetical protein DPX39_110005200 [Trypanosoma brucei equiperdum]|uniref:Uncharacterized protein n=1 Tax=Trypanosoma brucei equiperdum TaxID=630700 RepID=A0A3L6KV56_9TRYP|nr:hypothetical protein DPX39_110005200 [Trypanosoma brucei equiperdum]
MFRRLHVPITSNFLVHMPSMSRPLLATSVRCGTNGCDGQKKPANDDEDYGALFDSDFEFLDEFFEDGIDVLDYIPESEASLLGGDGR